MVAGRIDREQYEWLNMSVRATDNGVPQRSSHALLSIYVVDENDNNPIFEEASYNFTVTENSDRGTEVGQVRARDLDSANYGKVTYKINRRSSQGKFDIDPDSVSVLCVC